MRPFLQCEIAGKLRAGFVEQVLGLQQMFIEGVPGKCLERGTGARYEPQRNHRIRMLDCRDLAAGCCVHKTRGSIMVRGRNHLTVEAERDRVDTVGIRVL